MGIYAWGAIMYENSYSYVWMLPTEFSQVLTFSSVFVNLRGYSLLYANVSVHKSNDTQKKQELCA